MLEIKISIRLKMGKRNHSIGSTIRNEGIAFLPYHFPSFLIFSFCVVFSSFTCSFIYSPPWGGAYLRSSGSPGSPEAQALMSNAIWTDLYTQKQYLTAALTAPSPLEAVEPQCQNDDGLGSGLRLPIPHPPVGSRGLR